VSQKTNHFAIGGVLLCALVAVSCGKEAPDEDQPAAVQPTAGRYSVEDFGKLRWLEGSWRGQLPDSGYFFERYRVQDDSTIVMHGFPDSTFAQATDSGRITLRDGMIADEGSTRWVSTRLDSNVVDFASEKNAANGFSWARESPDRWKATLRSLNRERQPQTTVYPMERIAR
jgi:hypothetical protein